MNKLILILILFFLLVTFTFLHKRNENFTQQRSHPHTVVNVDDYINPNNANHSNQMNDLIQRGPPCLTKCLVENIPKVYWQISPEERSRLRYGYESDILQYNRENPDNIQDYCFRHNSNAGTSEDLTNPCNDSCRSNCNADPRCTVYDLNNGNKVCSVDNLNMMSSGSNLQLSNCKNCINKYWNNISNLYNTYQTYLLPQNCES